MNQIHNNLPAIELPFFTIFDWILAGIFFLGIVFFLFRLLYTKPQKEEKVLKPKPKIFVPPIFHLEKELQKLKQEAEQKHWKNFSLLATQTLKKICEQKFKKPFAFATGKEMEEILQEKISSSDLKNIHQFFANLDPIKFAKSEGQEKMVEEIVQILKTFKN